MQDLLPHTPEDEAAKTAALVSYLCLVAGYFTGLFWLIGGIWAIVKRGDCEGTRYTGHLNNAISVFWWGAGLCVIGVVTVHIIIGFFILLFTFIWSVYRLVKGLALLTSNKPYPL